MLATDDDEMEKADNITEDVTIPLLQLKGDMSSTQYSAVTMIDDDDYDDLLTETPNSNNNNNDKEEGEAQSIYLDTVMFVVASPENNNNNNNKKSIKPSSSSSSSSSNDSSSSLLFSHNWLRFVFCCLGIGVLLPYNILIACGDYYIALYPKEDNIVGKIAVNVISALILVTLFIMAFFSANKNDTNNNRNNKNNNRQERFIKQNKLKLVTELLWHILCSGSYRLFLGLSLSLPLLLTLSLASSSSSVGIIHVLSYLVGIVSALSESAVYVLATSYQDPSYTASVQLGVALSGFTASILRLLMRSIFHTDSLNDLQRGVSAAYLVCFALIALCLIFLVFIQRDQKQRELQKATMLITTTKTKTTTAPEVLPIDEEDNEKSLMYLSAVEEEEEEESAPLLLLSNSTTSNTTNNKTSAISWYQQIFLLLKLDIYIQTFQIAWKPIMANFVNLFITLSLFPGIITSIPSSSSPNSNNDHHHHDGLFGIHLGNWLPIVFITIFNAADVIGRSTLCIERLQLSSLLLFVQSSSSPPDNNNNNDNNDDDDDEMTNPINQSSSSSIQGLKLPNVNVMVWYHSLARLAFFPILALCTKSSQQQQQPWISSDFLRCILIFAFGFSNGFVSTASFMIAPPMIMMMMTHEQRKKKKKNHDNESSDQYQEAASLLVLLALYLGLVGGAYFGLIIMKWYS